MKKKWFSGYRWILPLLALVAVSLIIWFLGPYFTFGGLKPLEGIGMRVLLIALALGATLLWLKAWSMSPMFVALLCLLIWHAAPLLGFGEFRPFAPESVRIAAVVIVLALFALYWLIWLLHRMRTDKDFLDKALKFGSKAEPSPAAERLRIVESRANVALTRLRRMRTNAKSIGRIFKGANYLYELPWYICLGATSAGKTHAVLQSGLQFESDGADRHGNESAATEYAHWRLSNDAVFIDTAGHYTHHGQSSGQVPARPANTDVPIADADWRRTIDAEEWHGFIALLRRRRPRVPVNGALLTVKLDVLTSPNASVRSREAAALRARLLDMRNMFGIRFPVYLIVAQMDRLPGFTDYFASLTNEHRAQVWGFTLPLDSTDLGAQCTGEFLRLSKRLSDGLNSRLDDEDAAMRRQRLAVLPEAFDALQGPLVELLLQLFPDSRYDDTQAHGNLRAVFFTSALQAGQEVVSEPLTIVQRLAAGLSLSVNRVGARAESAHGFFLHDAFKKVILPEAHLVRPNLRWEYRSRVMRIIGHTLALLMLAWLAVSLHVSFSNNRDYLSAIGQKTDALAARVMQFYKAPKTEALPDTLDAARTLPSWTGLDLDHPDSTFRYGLYTAPGVIDVSRLTYRALEEQLLLPQLVRRIEDVISQSIAQQDAESTYNALRVYLMLSDGSHFKAADIKAWIFDDWAKTDSAAVFGGRAAMIAHVDQLFSGERIVRSPLIRNDALIQRARAFLDSTNATQRIYERAKAEMAEKAPDDFSLLRAVGPDAGAVFTRASGAPLSRGVPGLFTFDGYRNVFDPGLKAFVEAARNNDTWVMGRAYFEEAQKKTADFASHLTHADDSLSESIRRLYLTEYAQTWDAFLNDLRPVSGTSLGFDLQVLRRLAAPDSPLTRLANAVVRETTLTRAIPVEDSSLLQQTSEKLADKANKVLGIRPHERLERELVDTHFAALREIVTGSADSQPDSASKTSSAAVAGMAGMGGMGGVTNLLNDYYTALMVADSAIANNSMPPAGDAAAKLRMTANTLPAPLRGVLLGLSSQGSREVNQGVGQLLSQQMQAVIGDSCRLIVEGNYPFNLSSPRDISIEDFTRLFAQDGVLDGFFNRNLAPFVDTAARPWRYKTIPGATEPVRGPDLEAFQHAKAIRDAFFGDRDQKQLTWKSDIQVVELDPSIMGLSIDIDGQGAIYQHGPVTPLHITWPGPRGGVHAEITANPRIRPETSTISTKGAWAFMRMLQQGELIRTATPGRTRVEYAFDGRKAVLDIANTGSLANPLTSDLLTTFRCPRPLPASYLLDTGPPPDLPGAP